ncbi:hypothetical protein H1Q59_07485 [Holosporaceae bacterium 'Namur']|nr:hypothetical protein [Holosporaceae bacterium 'Namur']
MDKNFHIKIIKNSSLDEGLYSPVTKELIVADNYGSFSKKNLMHELSHKLMHQIFSYAQNPFTSHPYDNEKDKAGYEDAVGKMLDNILLNYYKIDNLQSILELKEDYYSSSNYERGFFIAKLYLPLVVKEGNDEFLQFIVKHFKNIEWDLIDDWFDYKETAEPLLFKLYNIVTEQDTDLLEFIALHLKDINLDEIEGFVERPNITQALLKGRDIDQDSLMESWKCSQVIGNLIGIFSPYTLEGNEHYTLDEMDDEIIVRYPEAIAENCYKNNSVIQSIFDPIKVYWENVIEIRMNEYNLRHDKSEYCAANDNIWDFI